MAKILTYKSRIEQYGNCKWKLTDNELVQLDNGRLAISPRFLLTDNITFVRGDFADVIAAHIHDIGCAFHKIIYVNLTEQQLKDLSLLKLRTNRSAEETRLQEREVEVWGCDNIPKEYLSIEQVGFHRCNQIFKEILLAAETSGFKANIMFSAVHLNVGWLKKPKEISIEQIYNEYLKT